MLANIFMLIQEAAKTQSPATTGTAETAGTTGTGTVPAVPAQAPGFDWGVLIMPAMLFAIFYFLLIRPQRKEQKKRVEMLQKLEKGDKVMTTGGMIGKIVAINDEEVTLEVDENVRIRFSRAAISHPISNDEKKTPALASR